MNAQVEALLDRDLTTPFTDEEVDALREAQPLNFTVTMRRIVSLLDAPGWEPLPELAFTFCRLKSRRDEPVTAESLALDGALIRLLPRSTDYYRARAEEARRPRRQLAIGVQR
jgi:hypothetical protein